MPWPGEIVLKRLRGRDEEHGIFVSVVEFLLHDPRSAQKPDNDIGLLAWRKIIRHEYFALRNREALPGHVAFFRFDHASATRFGGWGGAPSEQRQQSKYCHPERTREGSSLRRQSQILRGVPLRMTACCVHHA